MGTWPVFKKPEKCNATSNSCRTKYVKIRDSANGEDGGYLMYIFLQNQSSFLSTFFVGLHTHSSKSGLRLQSHPCVFSDYRSPSNILKGLGGTSGLAPLVGHALLRRDFRLACEILVCGHEVRGDMEVFFGFWGWDMSFGGYMQKL